MTRAGRLVVALLRQRKIMGDEGGCWRSERTKDRRGRVRSQSATPPQRLPATNLPFSSSNEDPRARCRPLPSRAHCGPRPATHNCSCVSSGGRDPTQRHGLRMRAHFQSTPKHTPKHTRPPTQPVVGCLHRSEAAVSDGKGQIPAVCSTTRSKAVATTAPTPTLMDIPPNYRGPQAEPEYTGPVG